MVSHDTSVPDVCAAAAIKWKYFHICTQRLNVAHVEIIYIFYNSVFKMKTDRQTNKLK